MTLYLAIPVYNEALNAGALLDSLATLAVHVAPEFELQTLIVDDGSSDGTGEIVGGPGTVAANVVLLRHATNRGPGAAFGTAFEHLHGRLRPGDWVATMEGDNTSSVETLLHMLIRRGEGYDAILASPYAYGGGFSDVRWDRLLLSHGANLLVKLVLGIHGIHTFSSFFRVYRGELIERLQEAHGPRIIESAGFECMVELLAKMIRAHARISEVEHVVDWGQRRGPQKMRVGRTIRGYLRLFLARASIRAPVPYRR